MDRVSSLALSPDQKSVLFVRRSTDLAANKGRSDLWRLTLADGELRQLTKDPAADYNPLWAPDGQSAYFLSTRSGSSQIWQVPATGGQPTQLSHLPLDISDLKISPDASSFAFSAEVFVDCETLACSAERLEQSEASSSSGTVYDRLFVRHWDTWKDGRRKHLFAMPVAGGTPVDVSQGMDADAPSKPFGGAEEYTFTPDGKALVFAARDAGRSEPWSTNFDLFAANIDAETKTPPRKLTADNPAWDTHPVFSPDGKTLAYLAMDRAGFEADRFQIVLQSWPDGERRVLTQDWDRSVSDMHFSSDGKSLVVQAGDTGHTSLFSIDLASAKVSTLVKEGHNVGAVVAKDQLVYLHDDFGHPAEIYAMPWTGEAPKALSHLNDTKVERAQRGEAEQFSFTGAKGDTVYGWMVKPANFDPAKRYPLAFLIHGGPQGSFSNRFHYRWNPQTYAGAGYAVITIDFHGSTGYGQDFTDAITGDWGGAPLEDLQKGLAYALDKYTFIDGDRACALGASYGGYMINWIAGNWPERFKCLVNHDGIFDNRSMYYSTEELWFPEWEHGGPYDKGPAGYEKHNPVNHVENWKTPMLVIHGDLDYRVPLEQGLATFTALQRRNIESRLLRFPDENHWVLKPANTLQWHEEVARWLDAHTEG
jgi:dipeptidyl aminopeptidase/acylaminoacyl peptidase